MSEEAKPTGKDEKNDKELSELLDSALDDFSKEKNPEPAKASSENDGTAVAELGSDSAEWSDEFIRQAAAQFETNMASLLGTESSNQLSADQLQASFQKMAEAASQVLSNPTEVSPESNVFASTISQTLQGLNEGTETLQNPFSEADIMNMLSGVGAAGGGGNDQNSFLPFMQGMMQSLLSKEVLYPSLKDILEKYPAWIEDNKDKVSAEELERYKKQQQLMEQVCGQLEKETESDTPEQKKEQFEKVLALMQKLQDHGQPPVELVGDVGPGLPLDAQSNLDPNQCSIV